MFGARNESFSFAVKWNFDTEIKFYQSITCCTKFLMIMASAPRCVYKIM